MKKQFTQYFLISSSLAMACYVAPYVGHDMITPTEVVAAQNIKSTTFDELVIYAGASKVLHDYVQTNPSATIEDLAKIVVEEQNATTVDNSTETTEEEEEEDESYIGWTITNLNVRTTPSIDSEVVEILPYNSEVTYLKYNDEWYKIILNETEYYIASAYISNTKCEWKEVSVPSNNDFKAYMGYKCITSRSSLQYKLQQYACTGTYGIRMVDHRYCVAVGTYFGIEVGQYFDLVLSNGTIIPCIMSDIKDNKDTDSRNIITVHDGSVTEFVVDTGSLVSQIKSSGSVSSACDAWNSSVASIRIYNTNYFVQ